MRGPGGKVPTFARPTSVEELDADMAARRSELAAELEARKVEAIERIAKVLEHLADLYLRRRP